VRKSTDATDLPEHLLEPGPWGFDQKIDEYLGKNGIIVIPMCYHVYGNLLATLLLPTVIIVKFDDDVD
jgi:phosphatidate phosphatase APP1